MTYDRDTDRSLCKDEIIRGYDSFKDVFRKSRIIESKYLKCYLQSGNKATSPQVIKVGFTVSKKKVKKAFLRNRIKRLIRETYRNNKLRFQTSGNLKAIFTIRDLKENDIDFLIKDGYYLFGEDMKVIKENINKLFTER